ncbi:MAG: SurA N-terminal domain-containing protein [Sphingomonadales bacterium]|nr:SurA N-terminal domain-containing protein [Sphingomonadales bacterium]
MLDRFRRLSKSKVGTGILIVFGVGMLASFALSDVTSLRNGNFGLGSSTLVKVGGREVTDRDVSQAMAQLLNRAREQNPNATSQDLAGEFDPLLQQLVQSQALTAFGEDNGLVLSKRLFDAEIAKLPQTRGLDGKFSDAAYQAFLAKERLTDGELRRLLEGSLAQRLLLAPAAANARLSVGLAAPYATMLMEQRQGELALVPIAAFAAELKPTDAQLAAYYNFNRAHYTVPEQRTLRIARFGPANVASAAATDQEIAAYYQANQAIYGAKETRVISQAVVPDAKAAAAIAQRARSGASFVAAAQPAGLSAEDVSVGPQTRAQFGELAGDKVAAATFAPTAKAGTIIGPIQSDLGWHVIRIDSIKGDAGKTLEAAKPEIATKLNEDKRKTALTDLVNRIQDAIDGGQSFAEVVGKNQLGASETPLVTAQGTSRADPAFKLPAEIAGALKSGFEMTPQGGGGARSARSDSRSGGAGLDRPASSRPRANRRQRDCREGVRWDATGAGRVGRGRRAARTAPDLGPADRGRSGAAGRRRSDAHAVHAHRRQKPDGGGPGGAGLRDRPCDQNHPRQCHGPAGADRAHARTASAGRVRGICASVPQRGCRQGGPRPQ